MQHTSLDIYSWHEKIKTLKILVIGDLMLDCYINGSVNRISPEAPVPVLLANDDSARLGGAANVAVNCAKMGANVTIAGVVGQDEAGQRMMKLLQDADINTDLVLIDSQRPTTTKTRISSRHQQLLRIDKESEASLNTALEHRFIDVCMKYIQIEKPDAVIFEDYDKGVLNAHIIEKISSHCNVLGCVVTVDPKKKNFLHYKNVDIFKPNLSEIRTILNKDQVFDTLEDELDYYQNDLSKLISHQNIIITLSENGVYYNNNSSKGVIPAKRRTIADVSGAGDTVIAVATIIYTITKDIELSAICSNIAGGLVCEYPGVVPVDYSILLQEITNHLSIN